MYGIIVFGDSITHGRGENPSTGWVGRLKKDFEEKDFFHCVYNLGIPGDTSTDLLERFETELSNRARHVHLGDKFIVVIAIGTNDAVAINNQDTFITPPKKFLYNLHKLARIAKKYTNNIAFIGLTPVDESKTNPYENTFLTNERQKEYDSIIKKVAESEDTTFIDVFSVMEEFNYKELLSDGLHPNSEGYQKMYKIISSQLLNEKTIK